MQRFPFVIVILICIAAAATNCAPTKSVPTETAKVDFATEVKPLLQENCLPCHHSETLSGGLNLESRQTAFRISERGAPIVAGNASASLVYTKTAVQHGKQEDLMPADGIILTDKQRDLLRRWIDEGAEWPEGKDGMLTPLKVAPGEA